MSAGRPERPLAGKVVLVTGAGRRVGRAIALEMGSAGAQVAVHFNESAGGALETVGLLEAAGGAASVVQAQLGAPEAPAELVDEVVRRFGRLDVLVNSAASMVRTPLGTVTPAQWDAIFALNLRAPFFLSLAAAKAMGDAAGAIINISDHLGFEHWAGFEPHGIAKAAVASMTHALAAALAPRIRVNAVAPGAVLAPEGWPASEQERYRSETPLGRIGTPEDVARAVRYLAGAEYVTGEILFVDGGRHGAR